MSAPFLYRAWVLASRCLIPFAASAEARKLNAQDVPATRAGEKRGIATQPRPSGALVWVHAASVGESLSVLALITRMGHMLPDAHFLITSGPATSARLVDQRLPPRSLHQFAPLDAPGPLKRFLAHWQPDAAIFVESEIWPQMLRRTHATGAPMALVNARMSDKTVEFWEKWPRTGRYLFDVFTLIVTQNDAMARNMIRMHAPADRVSPGVNLKSMAGPLPVDAQALAAARTALGGRAVWVASSTHEGEERSVLDAHKKLLREIPDLCLILAPRHPERGDAVEALVQDAGLTVQLRSRGDAPGGRSIWPTRWGNWVSGTACPMSCFWADRCCPLAGITRSRWRNRVPPCCRATMLRPLRKPMLSSRPKALRGSWRMAMIWPPALPRS